jgi:TRAP-type uncharacterized transport system fused permease subunit
MIKLGVPDFAAHKFIFYTLYYPKSRHPRRCPPLPPAAITGGNPYNTTMMAWKYTLPAFLVPFIFTVSPDGIGLLLKGSWGISFGPVRRQSSVWEPWRKTTHSSKRCSSLPGSS